MRFSRHIPNILTISRFALLTPFTIMALDGRRLFFIMAIIVWVCATAMDVVDGYIARTLGAVTELGAVLDLVVDRIMIATGVVLILLLGSASVYLVLLIVGREMVVDSVRALRLKAGHLLPHNVFGQAKMTAVCGAVVSALAGLSNLVPRTTARYITDSLLAAGLIFGVISVLHILNLLNFRHPHRWE